VWGHCLTAPDHPLLAQTSPLSCSMLEATNRFLLLNSAAMPASPVLRPCTGPIHPMPHSVVLDCIHLGGSESLPTQGRQVTMPKPQSRCHLALLYSVPLRWLHGWPSFWRPRPPHPNESLSFPSEVDEQPEPRSTSSMSSPMSYPVLRERE
jgi:hypothetical protein